MTVLISIWTAGIIAALFGWKAARGMLEGPHFQQSSVSVLAQWLGQGEQLRLVPVRLGEAVSCITTKTLKIPRSRTMSMYITARILLPIWEMTGWRSTSREPLKSLHTLSGMKTRSWRHPEQSIVRGDAFWAARSILAIVSWEFKGGYTCRGA